MKVFDIFIAYVTWGGGGKSRPVLILAQEDAVISVFNITTQYEKKSPVIRAKYYPIIDWQGAGLDRPSYVDTNTIRDLPSSALDAARPIGALSDTDKRRLIEFLNQD